MTRPTGAAAAFRGALSLDPLVRFLDDMLQPLLPLLALALFAPTTATAQAGSCEAPTPAGYDGPCFHGALPAYFDDFRYVSGRTTGDVSRAPAGDLFGQNPWYVRTGTEVTRGWYRYNRNDHAVPGRITFSDGTMRMLVPRGTPAEDFVRSQIIHGGATFLSGTYHYRVRFSRPWAGQELRLTAWTISPEFFVFEHTKGGRQIRSIYWSELDIEQQNHFQGTRETGQFVPDFVPQLTVANHYGYYDRKPGWPLILGRDGPEEHIEARGGLARAGFARDARIRQAPLLDGWWEQWVDLLIHVDPETRLTTYEMRPVEPDPTVREVVGRRVTIDERFYPRLPMNFAFSVHWINPSGRLEHDLWLDVDWIYHSPVASLSMEDVQNQVEQLRARDLPRVNTTGQETFLDHGAPLEAHFSGPDRIACGQEASWRLDVNRAGFLHTQLRWRTVDARGQAGRWREHHDFELTVRPDSRTSRIEIEATIVDRWRPHGVTVDRATEWEYPARGNETATARLSVGVNCPR